MVCSSEHILSQVLKGVWGLLFRATIASISKRGTWASSGIRGISFFGGLLLWFSGLFLLCFWWALFFCGGVIFLVGGF